VATGQVSAGASAAPDRRLGADHSIPSDGYCPTQIFPFGRAAYVPEDRNHLRRIRRHGRWLRACTAGGSRESRRQPDGASWGPGTGVDTAYDICHAGVGDFGSTRSARGRASL